MNLKVKPTNSYEPVNGKKEKPNKVEERCILVRWTVPGLECRVCLSVRFVQHKSRPSILHHQQPTRARRVHIMCQSGHSILYTTNA